MFKLTFIALVIACICYVQADFNLPILDIRWQVENAQYTYNRNLDRIFAIGFLQGCTAQFNQSLDELMSTFCTGNDFISWNSFFGTLTSIPTFEGTKEKYANLATTLFQNASRHIVSNAIVIPYLGNDGRLRTLYNSSASQLSFSKQASGAYVPTQTFGWYSHTWLFTNNKWCMQKFQAFTVAYIIRPFDQLPYFIGDVNIL